jgi:hypothetical protein
MQRLQYYPPHFAQSRPYVKALLREIDARMNPGPFTYDQIASVTAKAITNAFADTGAKLDTSDLDPQAFALERCCTTHGASKAASSMTSTPD